jgi:hypothetical protein
MSSMQRIYILPAAALEDGSAVVYAPVPLGTLSKREMRDVSTCEAWIAAPSHTDARGRVSLPVMPGEPLLPGASEK